MCSRPPIKDTLEASDQKVRDLLSDVNIRELTLVLVMDGQRTLAWNFLHFDENKNLF